MSSIIIIKVDTIAGIVYLQLPIGYIEVTEGKAQKGDKYLFMGKLSAYLYRDILPIWKDYLNEDVPCEILKDSLTIRKTNKTRAASSVG